MTQGGTTLMTHPHFQRSVQLVLGTTIALAGILFTLDNLDLLRARDFIQFWPMAFIAIGVAQIIQGRTTSSAVGGAIWIAIGGHMIGRRLGLWDTRIWDYWPVALIVFGGHIVWQAFHRAELRAGDIPGPPGEGRAAVTGTAILGGFDRKITSQTFERAEISAFMGGGKLDLRDAQMAGSQAVVDVFALMGGFEILVPETWNVEVEVTPFMGGYENKTISHAGGTAPRLVIRGFVMMGGLDIKHR